MPYGTKWPQSAANFCGWLQYVHHNLQQQMEMPCTRRTRHALIMRVINQRTCVPDCRIQTCATLYTNWQSQHNNISHFKLQCRDKILNKEVFTRAFYFHFYMKLKDHVHCMCFSENAVTANIPPTNIIILKKNST